MEKSNPVIMDARDYAPAEMDISTLDIIPDDPVVNT